jgi:hypothetical protein
MGVVLRGGQWPDKVGQVHGACNCAALRRQAVIAPGLLERLQRNKHSYRYSTTLIQLRALHSVEWDGAWKEQIHLPIF